MLNQTEFQSYLRKVLADCQTRNPSYSVRSFAKKLGVGFGTLSMVLNGKRSLSPKTISKIIEKLDIDPKGKQELVKRIAGIAQGDISVNKPTLAYEFTQLKADQHFVLSEWYYLAILSLIRTRDFQSTPQHISERLGISPALAKQATDRLERLGLIVKTAGVWKRTANALNTTDEVKSSALRKSHQINLNLAAKSLDEDELETRDFTWQTCALDPSQLPAAKKKIRNFLDEFGQEFSTSKQATEVYRFSTQLFALSKPLSYSQKKEKKK